MVIRVIEFRTKKQAVSYELREGRLQAASFKLQANTGGPMLKVLQFASFD
jgi:hypothetical protein